jgi:hypothetical protein
MPVLCNFWLLIGPCCWQAGYDSEGSEGEEEEDLQKSEWMGFNPPYSEAVEYEEIIGLPSYKLSKNPM